MTLSQHVAVGKIPTQGKRITKRLPRISVIDRLPIMTFHSIIELLRMPCKPSGLITIGSLQSILVL